MLDQSNALEASRQVIDGLLNTARECTKVLPDTPETRALYALPGFLAQQTSSLGV